MCIRDSLAVNVAMISGLSFMLTSIILLMLSQRGIVTIFDDGKDVIPLKAFLDWRPQGGYDNATIILVQVRKEILSGNRIIGCGIEEKTATMFEVYLLNTYKDYIHRFYQSLTHDEAVVLCYDLKLSHNKSCLLYTSPSPRDATLSRMPSSA